MKIHPVDNAVTITFSSEEVAILRSVGSRGGTASRMVQSEFKWSEANREKVAEFLRGLFYRLPGPEFNDHSKEKPRA